MSIPISVETENQSTNVASAGSVALIMSPIVIDPEILPFQLAEGAFVDKARPEEIERFRNLLVTLGGTRLFVTLEYFENELVRESIDGGTRISRTPLAQQQWRYYVVRTDDNGAKNIDLGLVSGIGSACLDFGTISILQSDAHSYRPAWLMNYMHNNFSFFAQQVTIGQLLEIAELYALKMAVAGGTFGPPGPFPEIDRALQMLCNLGTLTPNSTFHVLGLFAIIEMMVTHNPKLEDRGDSITHQMKGKIPLLSRRFDRPLPYAEHFGAITTDKIWSSLYAYRSSVAHGGALTSEKGPLNLLGGQQNADAFLFTVVQSLIRHALREPHLYRDIKGC
jgi:hypothetical protein